MATPLVSVIVTTKNSGKTMRAFLQSVAEQDYPSVEIVVVDNGSTDDTKDIAREFTKSVYDKGPERSTQRNYAVEMAKGTYVVILDSDMVLSPQVVSQCVAEAEKKGIVGVVIPEESFGIGFWAQCKKLERSFYEGVSWMEAARFFPRDLYLKVGGYDVRMVSGEDWDLSQRIAALGTLSRCKAYIYHNEGHLSLLRTVSKKYYYATKFSQYSGNQAGGSPVGKQTSVLGRYALYFSRPGKLFKNPALGIGMLFMKTVELGAGGFGYLKSKVSRS